jgi:hypothetical protein
MKLSDIPVASAISSADILLSKAFKISRTEEVLFNEEALVNLIIGLVLGLGILGRPAVGETGIVGRPVD